MKETVIKSILKICFMFMFICVLAMSMSSAVLAQDNETTLTQTPPEKTKLTITSVSPNQASQGQTLSVTVAGTNFTDATEVFFGRDIFVTSFAVSSDTQITANIVIANRAFIGSRLIAVIGPTGRSVLKDGFAVVNNAPTITGISPNQGSQGQALSVTVAGTNFTGAIGVFLGKGIHATSFTVTSAMQITADVVIANRAPVGSRPVVVIGLSGEAVLKDGFTVLDNAPTITGVSPNEGSQGQTLSVTVTGTHFTGAKAVFFGKGILVTSFTVISDTQITADIVIVNRAPVGSRLIAVIGLSGQGVLKDKFTVLDNTPTIASVSPSQGSQGQTLSISVTGKNFTGAKEVFFGKGIYVTSFTVTNDTQITADIVIANQAPVGSRHIEVIGPSGKGILKDGFSVIKSEQASPVAGKGLQHHHK